MHPILDHILRQLDEMRDQAQADDEMILQLGCDEEDNDIHDDPSVTESANDPIINEAAGVSEQAGTLGSEESQMESLLDQMTETLRDSINDRFQSVYCMSRCSRSAATWILDSRRHTSSRRL